MDKVVLITGAGAGIGKEITLQYADLKAKISIADVDVKGLEETVKNIPTATKDNILKSVVDLTNDDEVKQLVNNTITKFGKIDILINCAGIIRTSSILDTDFIEIFDKVMSINLRSMVLLTSLCAPHLIKTKGCVVNIASVLSVLAHKKYTIYNVSKAGVDHFTRCIALELATHGVRVNAVLPGVVKSKLYENSGLSEMQAEYLYDAVAAMVPLNRVLETREIADLVLFLASDKAKSITGASYAIDAGTLLTGFKD